MRRPPPKRSGQARGPRRMRGATLDVAGVAAWLGWTEKRVRSCVARGRLPYRRDGGRILFLRSEIEVFLNALPGLHLDEALANVRGRREGV